MNPSADLGALQQAFMAQVLDEDAPLPHGWGKRHAVGMSVYRGNYRSALVEAMRSTYERTEKWVGEAAFRRAAAHHLIAHPPSSWTIDDAGAGFDMTCAELFANDPEVAELAWLEWTMLEAAIAPDVAPLDLPGFSAATGGFGDEDWADMRLTLLPGSRARVLAHDLRVIWKALGEEDLVRPRFAIEGETGCLVWREGERATFIMVEADEARAFEAMRQGSSYGEVCMTIANQGDQSDSAQSNAAMRAGAMLGRWLNEGLIAAIG